MTITIRDFIRQSNAIEGIYREPQESEIRVLVEFLSGPLSVVTICQLQATIAPGYYLRSAEGMSVTVGGHVAPPGGTLIPMELSALVNRIVFRPTRRGLEEVDVFRRHAEFESLHPFEDGNGRTGRAVWAWHMRHAGLDPFEMPFLQRWYYQSLAASDTQS